LPSSASNRYFITPKAAEDIELITSSYENNAFLEAAAITFTLLASHPKMGWRHKILRRRWKSVRVFLVKDFSRILVFYRPQQSGVDILRVVHGSRNLRKVLSQEGLE